MPTIYRYFISLLIYYLFSLGHTALSETITLKTPDGNLYGSLMIPKERRSTLPVVLIISGSGPTDRDGNSAMLPGRNNCLKMLAYGLQKSNIASLRYDKRGVGDSALVALSEDHLKIEDYVQDARLWVKKIKQDNRFSGCFIIGHSEGALIGILAAETSAVSGLISISGSGRPAHIVILEQVKSYCHHNKCPSDLLQNTRSILEKLSHGEKIFKISDELMALFRPSVQPYLISWFKIDPVTEIRKVSCPILIIQGSSDLQVSMLDGKLLSEANPKSVFITINSMNHVLKTVPKNRQLQLKSYQDEKIPISSLLIDNIVAFIKNNQPTTGTSQKNNSHTVGK
jgi:pimeloyl-ACP methyl ester carboxylesterase